MARDIFGDALTGAQVLRTVMRATVMRATVMRAGLAQPPNPTAPNPTAPNPKVQTLDPLRHEMGVRLSGGRGSSPELNLGECSLSAPGVLFIGSSPEHWECSLSVPEHEVVRYKQVAPRP